LSDVLVGAASALIPGTGLASLWLRHFRRTNQELQMNWDRIEGNWRQLKGKAIQQWGKLTDDQFDRIAGKREQLVGQVQEAYGISKDEADKQVKDWESRL